MQDPSRATIGRISAMLAVLASFAGMIAVSCSEPPQACQAYVPPPSTDLTRPTSLRNDVLPVFAVSCAFSTCHGNRTPGASNGIYLGQQAGGTDATAVRALLLGKSASIDMPFVTPGDPAHSFLMHKIDGDLCTLAARCTRSCGVSMPQNTELMTVDRRDVVRRWIAEGALDD